MYTRSTRARRSVANDRKNSQPVSLYTSAELDELAAQLESLDHQSARASRTTRARAAASVASTATTSVVTSTRTSSPAGVENAPNVSHSIAREWVQLALTTATIAAVIERHELAITGTAPRGPSTHDRPSRAQVRVLRRLVATDGTLDPRHEDDAQWCDPSTLRAMCARRWIVWHDERELWCLTSYGVQTLARHDARASEELAVQLVLVKGGA